MSSSERPAKRVRQACDSCRRKKSRCPGEKPVCSYCERLGQRCTYSDESLQQPRRSSLANHLETCTPSRVSSSFQPQEHDRPNNDTNHRLNQLETRLSEVLVALHGARQHTNSESNTPAPAQQLPRTSIVRQSPHPQVQSHHLSHETMAEVAVLYLDYCHCQPLPLFAPTDFSRRLSTRDEEVILAISAMALRFSSATAEREHIGELTRTCLDTARSLTMQRLTSGLIELSTLQSLCLLSWLDFYDGNTHRASMYSSIVSDLCKSSNLASNVPSDDFLQEEKLRCFWSIVLLQRLHPNTSGPFQVSFDTEGMPAYPKSSPRPPLQNPPTGAISETRLSDHKDLGILAYAIQLTEVWHKVAGYAHRRASAGLYPPWSPKSEYAKIIAHQMHSETSMPYSKHRFKPAKFEERSPEELVRHRDYWTPWLLTQIMYHTIICVLNHPLLLSLQLKNFRVASIPEIWLQHTDDLITQHSQWIIHIIELLEMKSFIVTDPFLAHCVAIVATIYLQQSFSDDEVVQQVKKENFGKCLKFCQTLGQKWPYVQQLATKLQQFERVVHNSYLNSAASQTNDKVFIDLGLFWEILESASNSDKVDVQGITFGQSLKPKTRPSITAEELDARLLPEPSRVTAAGSPANGLISHLTPRINSSAFLPMNGYTYPSADDFNVLAQSYFAQGQDFVGNMDDWWLMEDTNPSV